MPSMDIFKGTPPTEVLRVESEPPGADARTSQGQSCRTPCELTVQSGTEMTVSFALNGYQPQTVQVRPDVAPTSYSDSGMGGGSKLQPNPVYAELQSVKPGKKKSTPTPTRKQTAQKSAPATAASSAPQTQTSSGGFQSSYPWPDPR
jgi:PEGA domain